MAKQIRAVFCAVRRRLRGVGSSSEVVDDLGNSKKQQRRDEGRYQHRQSNQYASGSVSAGNANNDRAKGYEGDCRRKEANYAQDQGKDWLSVRAVTHGRRMPPLALV